MWDTILKLQQDQARPSPSSHRLEIEDFVARRHALGKEVVAEFFEVDGKLHTNVVVGDKRFSLTQLYPNRHEFEVRTNDTRAEKNLPQALCLIERYSNRGSHNFANIDEVSAYIRNELQNNYGNKLESCEIRRIDNVDSIQILCDELTFVVEQQSQETDAWSLKSNNTQSIAGTCEEVLDVILEALDSHSEQKGEFTKVCTDSESGAMYTVSFQVENRSMLSEENFGLEHSQHLGTRSVPKSELKSIFTELTSLDPLYDRKGIRELLAQCKRIVSGLPHFANPLLECIEDTQTMYTAVNWQGFQIAFPLQWEKRLDWLKSEMYFHHLSDEPARTSASVHRAYFTQSDLGVPVGWEEDRDLTGKLRQGAGLNSVARELGGALLQLQSLSEDSPERAVDALRKLNNDVVGFRMFLKTLPIRQNAIAEALVTFVDVLRTTASTVSEDSDVSNILSFLEESYNLVERALVENTALRSKYETLPDLNVRSISGESGTIALKLLQEAERIERSLLIDLNIQAPQEGFAKALTPEELAIKMTLQGARFLMLRNGDQNIGIQVLFTGDDGFPESVLPLVALLDKAGETAYRNFGWVDTLGIARKAIVTAARAGVSARQLLDDAAAEAAKARGVDMLFAKVRIGVQANSSINSHLKAGWQDTGIEYKRTDGTLFKLLRLPLA